MHDSIICEYYVDLHNSTLTIISRDHSMKYIFRATNVLTHYFENIQSYNVILAVEETPIENFVSDNTSLLLHAQQDAWPIPYDTLSDLAAFLKQEKYKYIVIYSSIGMCGWILAQDYTITESNLNHSQSDTRISEEKLPWTN